MLDLLGPRQQRIQITVFVDQRRGRLHANARSTRYIVHRVPCKRLNINDFIWSDAELLFDLLRANLDILHRIDHPDPRRNQLHQILVRGHNRHGCTVRCRLIRIGRDQIVGLVALHLDAGQTKGPRRIADQRKLRHQVFRRRRAMRLVLVVNLVAKTLGRIIQDHRQMGRALRASPGHQPVQHVAIPGNCANRQPVRLARERRQGVIGVENIARPIHQIQMIALAQSVQLRGDSM